MKPEEELILHVTTHYDFMYPLLFRIHLHESFLFCCPLTGILHRSKTSRHSSIVCTVGLHWLYYVRCGTMVLHLEFSVWNSAHQTWTEHALQFMGWSQMELKCTQRDCKNFEHQVCVSLLVCMLKNCYSDLFFYSLEALVSLFSVPSYKTDALSSWG